MDEIFDAVKQMALIQKSGGGTGFSFSRIRPKNDVVGSTQGISSGPVSFMRVFDAATETVKQGGTRRGANMGILRMDHPDILDFIECKEGDQHFTNFNISVAVTDEFMEAVKKEGIIPSGIQGRRRSFDFSMPARCLKRSSIMRGPTGIRGSFLSTGSIRTIPPLRSERSRARILAESNPFFPTSPATWDPSISPIWSRMEPWTGKGLAAVTKRAVHFLDNVIDMNRYTLPQIEAMTKANRKIGLGVMGFADLLIQLGIPYDHPEALMIGEKVMALIQTDGREASRALALKRGSFSQFRGQCA